ncbi:MAG: hypothetical protein ABEH43_10795, partial [Flavobacteriales bacterium]
DFTFPFLVVLSRFLNDLLVFSVLIDTNDYDANILILLMIRMDNEYTNEAVSLGSSIRIH